MSRSQAVRNEALDLDGEWRPVAGYEGWYEVSNDGVVRRSRNGSRTWVGRVLKPSVDNDGYEHVTLYRHGESRRTTVHKIVAEAFIGRNRDGKEINHIDGDKRNNAHTNLEYVSVAENHRHASVNGLKAFGERNGRSKLSEGDVLMIRKLLEKEQKAKIARMFGVGVSTIGHIAYGHTWTHLEAENV